MLTDQAFVDATQPNPPRSNILGNVPERLAVGWEQGRQRDHGWEVPIRVASSDPSVGLGNTIAIVSLGGTGGISGKKSDVEATAGEIVRTYNGARDLEHRVAGAERDRDSAAACLAELLDVIAEHEGSRPVEPARRLREILAARPADCEHLFAAVQEAGKRAGDVWRIADSTGIEQRDDEDTYQWLERSVRELQAKARRSDRRPRIFTFANGSEIDVDRYLGLDATATSRTDHGDRPAITFQLGHGGFLRVAFESEQQRADELARMRAYRDGAA